MVSPALMGGVGVQAKESNKKPGHKAGHYVVENGVEIDQTT
jgi:hypothetical protein